MIPVPFTAEIKHEIRLTGAADALAASAAAFDSILHEVAASLGLSADRARLFVERFKPAWTATYIAVCRASVARPGLLHAAMVRSAPIDAVPPQRGLAACFGSPLFRSGRMAKNAAEAASDKRLAEETMAVLDLRPNCECCDKNLAANSPDAFICTFECTYCRDCAEGVLAGRCPNCLGNLVQRPIRPEGGPTGGLRKYPASQRRVLKDGGCTQAPDVSRANEVWT